MIDDRLLIVGSANLNDHSMFNDTEAALVTDDAELAAATRHRLWAEHLECSIAEASRRRHRADRSGLAAEVARTSTSAAGRPADDPPHQPDRRRLAALRAAARAAAGPARRRVATRPRSTARFGRMADHTLPADTFQVTFDASIPPALEIEPGDTVTFQTGDVAYARLAAGESVDAIGLPNFNRVTGPVASAARRPATRCGSRCWTCRCDGPGRCGCRASAASVTAPTCSEPCRRRWPTATPRIGSHRCRCGR